MSSGTGPGNRSSGTPKKGAHGGKKEGGQPKASHGGRSKPEGGGRPKERGAGDGGGGGRGKGRGAEPDSGAKGSLGDRLQQRVRDKLESKGIQEEKLRALATSDGIKAAASANVDSIKGDVDQIKKLARTVKDDLRTGAYKEKLADGLLSVNSRMAHAMDPVKESIRRNEEGKVDAQATAGEMLHRGSRMPWWHCVCGGRVGFIRLLPIVLLSTQFLLSAFVYIIGAMLMPLGESYLFFLWFFHLLWLTSALMVNIMLWCNAVFNNIWVHLYGIVMTFMHVPTSIIPGLFWIMALMASSNLCLTDDGNNRVYCIGLWILAYGGVLMVFNFVLAFVLAAYWLVVSVLNFFTRWEKLKRKQFEKEFADATAQTSDDDGFVLENDPEMASSEAAAAMWDSESGSSVADV